MAWSSFNAKRVVLYLKPNGSCLPVYISVVNLVISHKDLPFKLVTCFGLTCVTLVLGPGNASNPKPQTHLRLPVTWMSGC